MCSQVSHFPSTGSEGLRLHVLKEVMEQAMERHPGSLEEDIPQTHSRSVHQNAQQTWTKVGVSVRSLGSSHLLCVHFYYY